MLKVRSSECLAADLTLAYPVLTDTAAAVSLSAPALGWHFGNSAEATNPGANQLNIGWAVAGATATTETMAAAMTGAKAVVRPAYAKQAAPPRAAPR